MVEEKPTAAFALSLVGGILWLFVGVVLTGALSIFALIGAGWLMMIGIYFVIMSIIIIIGAIMLYNNPSSAHTWGIVILVLSIIGGLNIFSLIGGILAMTWKPSGATRERAPPPPP